MIIITTVFLEYSKVNFFPVKLLSLSLFLVFWKHSPRKFNRPSFLRHIKYAEPSSSGVLCMSGRISWHVFKKQISSAQWKAALCNSSSNNITALYIIPTFYNKSKSERLVHIQTFHLNKDSFQKKILRTQPNSKQSDLHFYDDRMLMCMDMSFLRSLSRYIQKYMYGFIIHMHPNYSILEKNILIFCIMNHITL